MQTRFVTEFLEKGGESKVLQKLSNVRLRRKDSVCKYTQEFQTLISKLKEPPTETMKIEWYVSGVPKDMARHIHHAKVETLNAAIEAAQLFENTESIVENSGNTRTRTTNRKTSLRHCYNSDSDTSSSMESSDSNESSSNSDAVRNKKVTRATKTVKVEVKPEIEKITRLETELAEMQVQLADLQRPRRTTPTNRNNIWCGRCGEEGHYAHKCPLPQHKQVRMIEVDKRFPLFIQDAHDTKGGIQVVYQIQPVGEAQRKPFGGDRRLPPPGSLGQPP
jgi:hypothetical protein